MESIPLVDLRDASPLHLVERYPEKAAALLRASRDAFGLASRIACVAALPLGDAVARRWLEKAENPYLAEIAAIAGRLNLRGVYALNLAYEWGCTSAAYRRENGVILTRVLDWPFPALGENMAVARQRGHGGEFYNVTWPGVSGVFNAMMPGGFAAALNQAPMRRHRGNIVTDWVRNRLRVYRKSALPPAHLLRQAFERAATYEEAVEMLCNTPICLPVIYVVSGARTDEACVIERLEDRHALRSIGQSASICAANHFESDLNGIGYGWMPRAIDSHGRARKAAGYKGDEEAFDWFTHPVANHLSRLALVMDAGAGSLQLIGTKGQARSTEIFTLN